MMLLCGWTILFLSDSCKGPDQRQEAVNRIQSLFQSNALHGHDSSQILMDSLIRECERFITLYPNDTLTPGMFMKMGTLQADQGRNDQAIKVYDRIIKAYQGKDQEATAWFAKSMIYQEKMNDIDKAKACWKKVFETFPSSPLAKDAKILYDNANLSDEELLKKITAPASESKAK